jgi:hypothetical protein
VHDEYDYVVLRTSRDAPAGFRPLATEDARRSLTRSGGVLVGAWLGAGSIGWFDDEALVLVGWPERRGDAVGWLASSIPGARSEVIPMRATARPVSPGPVRSSGVHAHRWLEVEPEHFGEVVDLSAGAWPAFEASFEAHIEGLFQAEDGSGRMLLVTWYASVAEWERSRGVAGADQGALADARRNFQRRRELTRRQVVRLARAIS